MRPGAAQALALGSELQVRFSDGLVTEEVTSHYFCGRLQTGERLRTERRGGGPAEGWLYFQIRFAFLRILPIPALKLFTSSLRAKIH